MRIIGNLWVFGFMSSYEKEINSTVGKLIREYRKKSGFTQKDLADKLGYSQPVFVSLIETGQSKVPLRTLGKLIILLSIPENKVTNLLLSVYETNIKSELALGMKNKQA